MGSSTDCWNERLLPWRKWDEERGGRKRWEGRDGGGGWISVWSLEGGGNGREGREEGIAIAVWGGKWPNYRLTLTRHSPHYYPLTLHHRQVLSMAGRWGLKWLELPKMQLAGQKRCTKVWSGITWEDAFYPKEFWSLLHPALLMHSLTPL